MELKSTEVKKYDEKFMRRCIELSQESVNLGDAAFGSLIAIDDKLIAEGLNNYKTKISEHAEIVALNKAHKELGTSDLSTCTLYTSCEPCPMCSFMIREFKIKRVVFALPLLYVGGYSKWPILQDTEISKLKPIFSKPPEVLGGFMEAEAKIVMAKTPLWMFGNDAKSRDPNK
jgi:tRNA(adenine34) deaminase